MRHLNESINDYINQSIYVYQWISFVSLQLQNTKSSDLLSDIQHQCLFHLFVCIIIELALVDITNKHLEIKVRQRRRDGSVRRTLEIL